MKNQTALLLLLLALGTISSGYVQSLSSEEGRNHGKQYGHNKGIDDGHNHGQYNERKNKPCKYLKNLLDRVRRLSSEITTNLAKDRAEYKSKTALYKGLKHQLKSDLKAENKLIRQVNKNEGEISKYCAKIKLYKEQIKANEANLCHVKKALQALNKDLSHYRKQKNHLLNKYAHSKSIKGSLINENKIKKNQIHLLGKSIKRLHKQIKKLKFKRSKLHLKLIRCSCVIKQAKRLNKRKHRKDIVEHH